MIERAEDKLKKLESLHDKDTARFSVELELLERNKKVLLQTNADLVADNRALASEITVSRDELARLQSEEAVTKTQILELTSREEELAEALESLEKSTRQAEDALIEVQAESECIKEQLGKDIALLEQKKQNLANEIIENRAQDDKVRENLAVWERKLEDKDKNLRIREARVDQQEASVARNYNLLQL